MFFTVRRYAHRLDDAILFFFLSTHDFTSYPSVCRVYGNSSRGVPPSPPRLLRRSSSYRLSRSLLRFISDCEVFTFLHYTIDCALFLVISLSLFTRSSHRPFLCPITSLYLFLASLQLRVRTTPVYAALQQRRRILCLFDYQVVYCFRVSFCSAPFTPSSDGPPLGDRGVSVLHDPHRRRAMPFEHKHSRLILIFPNSTLRGQWS